MPCLCKGGVARALTGQQGEEEYHGRADRKIRLDAVFAAGSITPYALDRQNFYGAAPSVFPPLRSENESRERDGKQKEL